MKPSSEEVIVKVKRIHRDARIPQFANQSDVAMDLYSTIDYELKPGEWVSIPTGIVLEIPEGYEGEVRPRSGLALNHGITVLNSPGTIDSGYRGEIRSIIINMGKEEFKIEKGMRISQLAIRQVPRVKLVEADALSSTQRGEDGFGSTGL